MTTKSQETRAQILSTAAAVGIASKACQSYVQRLMNVNAEAMNFVSSRLRQDVELGESFARCKSWEDVSELQQAWGRKAVEDYMSMSKKIMELTSQMADSPWARPQQNVAQTIKATEDPVASVSAATPARAPKRVSKRSGARVASAKTRASRAKPAATPASRAKTAKKTGATKTARRRQKA